MLTEPITVQRDGHVLLIGVNRPAKRNAVNLAAMDALCGAYEILGTDEQLRAGVLFAHGDHFSAGLDLAEVGPAVAGHGPQVLYGSHRFDMQVSPNGSAVGNILANAASCRSVTVDSGHSWISSITQCAPLVTSAKSIG
jgi:enoyl-CoA hydratase/carnithine racemase